MLGLLNVCNVIAAKIRLIIFLLLIFCFSSCFNRNQDYNLDLAESVMAEHPDSALIIIKSIDTLSLRSSATMARYSLLHAIALDKNYIDTTDVNVVLPAVEYYRKHGTPDEILKSYYYLGRIQENSGDLNKAAISFSIAESVTPEATDAKTEGLLYMAFANIYNKTRNKDKEEEYVKKGILVFDAAGDSKHSNLSTGRLAILYYGKQEWTLADSLFRAGIEQAKNDTVAMSVFLSNYARLKVVQPNQDPMGAIELLNSLVVSYKRPLSLTDYGVWAFAAALTGDEQTCSKIEEQLLKLDIESRSTVNYWLYRIEQQRGNYDKALEYNIESNAYNSGLINNLLSDSIGEALHNYYLTEAKNSKNENQILRLRLILIVLWVALASNTRPSTTRPCASPGQLCASCELKIESGRYISSSSRSKFL